MHVKSLHIYPLKSAHGIDVAAASVEARGLESDRRWMVVDAQGKFITQREYPKLAQVKAGMLKDSLSLSAPQQKDIIVPVPQGDVVSVSLWKENIEAYSAGDAAHQWLSRFLGAECRLVYQGDFKNPVSPKWGRAEDINSFSDSFPVLVATTASMDDLNSRMEAPLPLDRFRPNIVIDGALPWTEDGWRNIGIGDVELELVKPSTRCVVTTVDQETGEKTGPEPMATLKKFRFTQQPGLTGVLFGQYAIPRRFGTIKTGDKVEILSSQPAPPFKEMRT